MGKTLPADLTKVNIDGVDRDPKAWRTEAGLNVDKVNELKPARGTAALLDLGDGLTTDTSRQTRPIGSS